MTTRYAIRWDVAAGLLTAVEPTPSEVLTHAGALSLAYNDPHNRTMMAHEADMTPAEVIDHYASHAHAGGRAFLLFRDRVLAGDADFRRIEGARAEFAILVGDRSAQGKGLGTSFAVMAHAVGFRTLGLDCVYVTIVEQNIASRRLFEKLGYLPDHSPEARSYADDDSDLSLSIGRDSFERAHASLLDAICVEPRR